ncbi:hypothetical protein [Streptomyces sp. NPDC001744]|uniref:hypothetical protein n=1 Tax=Streptomyces sp. NPDC001744 TaxID=3364606 RepID=UPI00368D117A
MPRHGAPSAPPLPGPRRPYAPGSRRARHRPAPDFRRTRRLFAAGVLGAGALAATLLASSVTPAAPPAPDRAPGTASSDVAQLSRD